VSLFFLCIFLDTLSVWDNRSDPPSLIATRDLAVHAQKRRRWNRAFNSAALKDYEEIIREKSKEFVESLGNRLEQEIDLNEWMGYFTSVFHLCRKCILARLNLSFLVLISWE